MGAPALPPGFVIDDGPPPKRRDIRGSGSPARTSGAVHDGDTLGLQGGGNARLLGADAFELSQSGVVNGRRVPLGLIARNALAENVSAGSPVADTGTRSYNRPVVTVDGRQGDAGKSQIAGGLALPVPEYLQGNPNLLRDYVNAQRGAIAAERGAYGGVYQTPSAFRHQGDAAPFVGKVPMSKDQFREYARLVRNPKTTPEQLSGWFAQQGHTLQNGGEILAFIRKNPYAGLPGYFIQSDALGQPVNNVRPLNEDVHNLDNGGWLDAAKDGAAQAWQYAKDAPGAVWSTMKEQAKREVDPSQWDDILRERLGGLARGGASVINTGAIGLGWVADRLGATGQEQAARDASGRINASIERFSGNPESPQYKAYRLGGEAIATAPAFGLSPIAGASRIARYGNLAAQGAVVGAATSEGEDVAKRTIIGGAAGPVLGAVADEVIAPLAKGVGRLVKARPGTVGPVSPVEPSPAPVEASQPPVARSMASEVEIPEGFTLDAPAPPQRVVDRIDVRGPVPPPGFVTDAPMGKAGPMAQRPTPEAMANIARTLGPDDVRSLGNNVIESSDEAAALSNQMRPLVKAPDERNVLETRWMRSAKDPSKLLPHKGPLDLVSYIRSQGGLMDQGGELTALGINNSVRKIEFAKREGALGKLVDNENGMPLDEAARNAWEAGYFPTHSERPTIAEFLDALDGTYRGNNRVFHPDDYNELDNYASTMDERIAVERGQWEGAPIARDLGRPATMADIEANQPPVTAYEDLPRVGGRVANINLGKLETRADIRRALQNTETAVGGFDAARRGRVSQGETEALASELGMKVDDLLKRRKGQALNAEEALAARQLLAKSSDELVAMAGRVKGGSDADLAAFRQAWLRHAAIQEQVTGATAEAGRALAQFKMAARSKAVTGRLHPAMIEGAGGRDRLEEAAGAILDLQNAGVGPGEVTKFAVKALKPKFSDKLVELWYNSLLSGPQTHAVNILSNSITAGLQLPEMATASALGQLRRASVDRVMASELAPRMVGLLQGTREGLRAFGRTLKTGEVSDFVTKVEAQEQRAISGVKGSIIRTPTRLLSAEDELFKGIARRMEINGLAVRKAKGEGLKGPDLYRRIEELSANPTDEMFSQSLDYARYLTYQRPLGPIGQSVTRMTQTWPALKLFLPFVRTPVNIMKYVTERSPAAPFLKEWRADVAAGGARRDLAIARVTLGTGLGLLVTQWAAEGKISGSGPLDDNAKGLMRADGWQPYSVRIGDKWYSYQRLDPLASTLGVAADFATRSEYMTDTQRDEAAGLILASVLRNLADKTWLSGISDVMSALDDPDRNAGRLVGRLAGSLAVPAGVAQVARTIDPVARQTRSPVDAIKARVPGLSDNLMPMRDVWGNEVVRDGGLGPDIVSPIWTSTAKNDPLNSEMLDVGARFGKPDRKVGGRKLTDQEFDRYEMLAGQLTQVELRKAMAGAGWAKMSKDDRQDAAEKIKREARKAARSLLFGGFKKNAKPDPTPVLAASPLPDGFVLDQ